MPSVGIWAKLGIPAINAEGERDMSKEGNTAYLDFSCPNSQVNKPASWQINGNGSLCLKSTSMLYKKGGASV